MASLFKKRREKEWYEKENCTYYGYGEEAKDGYIFGFVLKVIQGVCAGAGGEGGWLCELKHANHKEAKFSCFLTSTGFRSVSKFQGDIANTIGMPALIITSMDVKTLSSFIVWKNAEFNEYCKKNKVNPDKLPVENRNLQNDRISYCFGPELFYERKGGKVIKVSPAMSSYIWVQAKFNSVAPLELYSGSDTFNILEVIRGKLEEDNMSETFVNFLLICGHTTVLNLHYKKIQEKFGHVPALVITGPRNTGKTHATEVSISFLGTNADNICVVKDTSITALRERVTCDHFPLLIHDCGDPSTAATALLELYEGKKVKNHYGEQVPGATCAFTCNEKQMEFLQTRFESLSRAVVIPMLKQMESSTEQQFTDVERGKKVASRHFEALLNVTDSDLEALKKRAYCLRPKITEVLLNVTDSNHRIAENYGMVIASTELFLDKTGYTEWRSKVEPFVLNKLLPNSAPYFEFRSQTKGQVSFGRDVNNQTDTASLTKEFCAHISNILKIYPDKIWKCIKFMPLRGFIAVREQELLPLAEEVDKSFGVLYKKMRELPGVETGLQVRYSDEISKKSTGLPKSIFTVNQIQMLKNEVQETGTVETPESINVTTPPVSPFKAITQTDRPADSLSHIFRPPSTSTQEESQTSPSQAVKNLTFGEKAPSPIPSSSLEPITVDITTASAPVVATRASVQDISLETAAPNGSFTVSSEVADPKLTIPKKSKKRAPDCGGCKGEDKDDLPTYPCTVCKTRFHLACQTEDSKYWPLNTKARRRHCENCRDTSE